MAEEPTPPGLSTADYAMIEAAVMETSRGRWFLSEFAKRNRHADTESLLAALARLEGGVLAAAQATARAIGAEKTAGNPELAELTARLEGLRRQLFVSAGLADEPGQPATAEALSRRVESLARDARDAAAALAATARDIAAIETSLRASGGDAKLVGDLASRSTRLTLIVELEQIAARQLAEFGRALVSVEAQVREAVRGGGLAEPATEALRKEVHPVVHPTLVAPPRAAAIPTPTPPQQATQVDTKPSPPRPTVLPIERPTPADRPAPRRGPEPAPLAAAARPPAGPHPATPRRPSFAELAKMSPIERLKALS